MVRTFYTLRRKTMDGTMLIYPGDFETPEKAYKKSMIVFLETDTVFSIYETRLSGNNSMTQPWTA